MNARFLAWWQETGGGDSWQLRIAEQAWEAAFNVGYEQGVAAFHDAVKAEREACAKLVDVEQGAEAWEIHGGQKTIDVLRGLAAAIRARSNQEKTS